MTATSLWTSTVTDAPPPPLAPGLPLLGNAREMAGNPLPFLIDQYQRHGPIFRVRAAGRAFTVIAGPEANQLLAQADSNLLSSTEFWHDYSVEWRSPRLIGAQSGEDHGRMRRLHKPGMARGVILAQLPQMVAVVREGTCELRPGQRVAVLPLLQRIVSNQLGALMAGRQPGPYLDDVRRTVRYTLNALVLRQWPRAVLSSPAYRRSRTRVEELARAIIAERRAQPAPPAPRDLVDTMIAAHDEDPAWLSEDDLFVTVLGPFIAGLDTVANTSTFLVHALLNHPELYERAVAEADRVLGAGDLTAESLRSMEVFHGAAMEALRMYPVAGINQRTAAQDFMFAGRQVRAGETLLIAGGVAHYLPGLYADPHRFDIARYREPRNEHRQKGAFAPFGIGPHTCLGAGLAEVQIMVTTATLLHLVRLAPEPHYRPRVRLDPTITLGRDFRAEVVAQRQPVGGH